MDDHFLTLAKVFHKCNFSMVYHIKNTSIYAANPPFEGRVK